MKCGVFMKLFKLQRDLISGYTPLQCYDALKKRFGIDNCYIIESLSNVGNIEIINAVGFDKIAQINIKRNQLSISGVGKTKEVLEEFMKNCSYLSFNGESFLIKEGYTWDVLRSMHKLFAVEEQTQLGFMTFLGYDAVWYIEKLPYIIQEDTLNLPDICLVLYRGLITFNTNNSNALFEQIITDDFSPIDVNMLRQDFDKTVDSSTPGKLIPATNISDSCTKEEFMSVVQSCLEHIANGDIYQIQIGHELKISSDTNPFDVYLRLRKINPSPYMYFIPLNDAFIVGASPELFVQKQEKKVVMRPIAGTARRGKNDIEDKEIIDKLISDEKELAEHMMLVDLCRNDFSRFCECGTLDINEQLIVERYSHVFHLVSNVQCELSKDKDIFDVLVSTFPAGTMTGTPKIRAMEIIESYEKSRRSMYAGALGFISLNGDAVMALCIRTAIYKDGEYSIRASAGIVSDSRPENEWLETLNKLSSSYVAITGENFK